MNDRVKSIIKDVLRMFSLTIAFMLICGIVFPMLLSGLGYLFFPDETRGSLIEVDGKVIGSKFVGQEFTKPYFMKGRPSAVHYNTYFISDEGKKVYSDGSEFTGIASGSQNLAPSNPLLAERVKNDIDVFLEKNPEIAIKDIPTDLLTASGSGLDPHISLASAMVQIPAIASASGLSEEELIEIVEKNTTHKLLGVFGEEAVNVLLVNIDIANAMNK